MTEEPNFELRIVRRRDGWYVVDGRVGERLPVLRGAGGVVVVGAGGSGGGWDVGDGHGFEPVGCDGGDVRFGVGVVHGFGVD